MAKREIKTVVSLRTLIARERRAALKECAYAAEQLYLMGVRHGLERAASIAVIAPKAERKRR